MAEERPVGIVARADVTGATPDASKAADAAAKAGSALAEIPPAVGAGADAAGAVRAPDSNAQADTRAGAGEGVDDLGNDELDTIDRGRPPPRPTNPGQPDIGLTLLPHPAARSPRDMDEWFRNELRNRRRSTATNDPARTIWNGLRRLAWGPGRTPSGSMLRLPGMATGRVRGAVNALGAAGLFAFLKGIHKSIGLAGDYEARLARITMLRGDTEPELLGGDPDSLSGFAQVSPGGQGRVRSTLSELRELFLVSGREGLSTMEGLGYWYLGARAVAAQQFARRTGMHGRSVASSIARMLDYAHEGVVMSMGGPREPGPRPFLQRPEGRQKGSGPDNGPRNSGPWSEGAATSSRTLSMLQNVGPAMNRAGMRNRPEEFLGDVEAYTKSLGLRQGLVDPAVSAGFAAFMGSVGFGGSGRRNIGARMIAGSASAPDETTMAAKIAAVRAMGPSRIGAGDFSTVADPKTLRDAQMLIESGDPRTTAAYAAYARQQSARFGLGDDEAKMIFGRLTHTRPMEVERMWPHLKKLAKVQELGSGSLTDDVSDEWLLGPEVRGQSGGSWDSLARSRTESDEAMHAGGRQFLSLTRNIAKAMAAAAEGAVAGRPYLDALAAGLEELSPAARDVLITTGVIRGGAGGYAQASTVAAYSAKRWVQRNLGPVAGVVSAVGDIARQQQASGAQEPERPTSGALTPPIDGGRITSKFGDRHGDAHEGVDIPAEPGTPVRSVADGVVQYVRDAADFGRLARSSRRAAAAGVFVDVKHADGHVSRYMHLGDTVGPGGVPLRVGQKIAAGQQLGTVGTTGVKHSRPHLHFEIRGPAGPGQVYGPALDPATVLGGKR